MIYLFEFRVNNVIKIFLYTGYGVFVTKQFTKNDYLLTYKGELILAKEGEKREEKYGTSQMGNFMFFFQTEVNQKNKYLW